MRSADLADILDVASRAITTADVPPDPFAAADLLKACERVDAAVLALGRRIADRHRSLNAEWAAWPGTFEPKGPPPPPPPPPPPKPQPQPKPPPPPPPPPSKGQA